MSVTILDALIQGGLPVQAEHDSVVNLARWAAALVDKLVDQRMLGLVHVL